jgi:RNB domain
VTRTLKTDNSLPQCIPGAGRDDRFRSKRLCARIVASSATSGTTSRKKFKSNRWFPKVVTYDDDIFSEDEKAIAKFEEEVVVLTANLVRSRLLQQQYQSAAKNTFGDERIPSSSSEVPDSEKMRIRELVKGRFMDLTCAQSGEDTLERLFYGNDQIVHNIWMNATQTTKSMTELQKDDVIRGAVMILQSLCVMGTQVGVKGPPEQLKRMVEHLADQKKSTSSEQLLDVYEWTKDSVRRLKHKLDRTAAVQLLAELRWKQTPQGAFDLLVALGVWEKHEDLALLRSGFALRFTEKEEEVASDVLRNAQNGSHHPDPDTLLGIRQDLRHLKVYTIDGASAAEIDDGISIEILHGGYGNSFNDTPEATRYRIWAHIADAESWAPPHSPLFEAARRRVTSLYLPNGTISMFPSRIGTELMSLKVNEDVRALSLGVELNDDGSLNVSSLIVTPSLIRVAYRLTYDEVDEMLEEGIAYNEEWEIGALLMAATKRRELRIRNGSAEGLIPNPVPSSSVSIFSDANAPDSIGISLNIEVSHNAAVNKTAFAQITGDSTCTSTIEEPVSSAYLLVTEMMILAGEAIGVWKWVQEQHKQETNFDNSLRLPFRGQRQPGSFGNA